MKKQLIWVLSAVLLSGVSVTALASGHGMRDGSKGADVHLAKMELALKLEDAQRPAWNAFSKYVKDMTQARQQQRKGMREAMKNSQQGKNMGATERMDAQAQMMQIRQTQLTQMKAATQTFTAQLSPAQLTVFNAEWSDTVGHGGRKSHKRSDKKGQRQGCKA